MAELRLVANVRNGVVCRQSASKRFLTLSRCRVWGGKWTIRAIDQPTAALI